MGGAGNVSMQQRSDMMMGDGQSESMRSDANLSVTSEDRRQSFHDFLNRQNQAEMRKQKRVEQLRKAQAPKGTPAINKKSKSICKQQHQGDFLMRVQKNVLRKEHDKVHKKATQSKDPECTFHPKINQSAKKRQARSVVELSRGDMLKKETAQRLMKLKTEQQEMVALTFKPNINKTSVESKLKILTEPGTYLQRLQKDAKTFSEKQRRAVQAHEMAEFAQCTFQPKIHDAPAYVKRIAHSMRLARAGQARTNAAADKKK